MGRVSPSVALKGPILSTLSRYIGVQPWVELGWLIGSFVRAEVAYGHFFPGAAITQSGPGQATNHSLVSTTFTF